MMGESGTILLMKFKAPQWIAIGLTVLLLAAEYLRLFIAVPLGDEALYVGSALLTSIGARPFYHELFVQQTASLLYEPLIAFYYLLFGKFAIMLFARHLFLAFLLVLGAVTFFFCRRRTDVISALAIALAAMTGGNFGLPTLGYNSMGCIGFGCFALLALRAVEERSLKLSCWSGLFAFITLAAYPTFLAAVFFFWLFVALVQHFLKRPYWKTMWVCNLTAGGLLLGYLLSLVVRFGWDNIYLSYQFTSAHIEGGPFWPKIFYGLWLFREFAPWPWLVFLLLGLWWMAWKRLGLPWVFFLIPIGLFMISQVKARPEQGTFAQAFIFIGCLAGLPLLLHSLLHSWKRDWPELVLWATGMAMAPVLCWTSGLTYYSTHYSTLFSLVALLVLSVKQGVSRGLAIAMFTVPLIFIVQKWESHFLPTQDNVANLTEVIDWGAFAGIWTYPAEYNYLAQIQSDIDAAAKGSLSILFYDNFPGGYLMADLAPATRTWLMHGLGVASRVRPFLREHYQIAGNRPDVIFRFTKHMTVVENVWDDSDPKRFLPYEDVFWHYLPEESGDYTRVVERFNYSVYKRKGLP